MPSYEFECAACEIRFERNLIADEHQSYPCPSCYKAAPLVLSSFGFSFAGGNGAQGNSGVHDHDYPSADKAVGRSAEERWRHLHAREAVKKQAREQGETHALIRHTGKNYVDYEPMSDAGRDARRKLARETFRRMREKKG